MVEPPGRKTGNDNSAHKHPPAGLSPSAIPSAKSSALDQDILIRLKALRLSLGLSAAMMDRYAGFATGTIGRLERGDLRVYANHLYRICETTGIAIGYFFDQIDESEDATHSDTHALEKQRLLLAYMKIKDPALKRDVFELVETLAAESKPKPR